VENAKDTFSVPVFERKVQLWQRTKEIIVASSFDSPRQGFGGLIAPKFTFVGL